MKKELLKIIGEVYKSPVASNKQLYEKIDEWYKWYRGKVAEFHTYNTFNGITTVKRERKTLGMARIACSDKANYEMNENVNVSISDDKAQEYVDKVLFANNFKVKSNELVELANALGTGAFIQDIIVDFIGKRVGMQYVTGDMVFPLYVENGTIIDCAFVTESKINDKKVYDISIYRRYTDTMEIEGFEKVERGTYIIMNYKCADQQGKLNVVALDEEVPEFFAFNTFACPFQIIKPGIVNNYDPHSGMGVSLFANSIDQMKSIDVAFDSYVNEFTTGKKRIFINDDMIMAKKFGDTDKKFEVFDINETEFYGMKFKEGNDPIKEIDMKLRTKEHQTGINDFLNLYSLSIGFGQNAYKFTNGAVQKTATEVSSDNVELFATVGKDELILEKALIDMTISILELANNFDEQAFDMDKMEITVKFDDSIFEDDAEVRRNALLEFNSDLIDAVEYFVVVYGLTEKAAIKKVDEMAKRKPKEFPGNNDGGAE